MATINITNRKFKDQTPPDGTRGAARRTTPPPGTEGKLRTRSGASAYTGISLSVLDKLAKDGTGPRRVQVTPGMWRYHVDDLDKWMAGLPEFKAAD